MHTPKRHFEVASRSQRQQFKPKSFSHQHDLAALKGKLVRFTTTSGKEGVLKLVNADQFTLVFQRPDSKSVLTYFKHSIESYEPAE